MRGLLGTMMRMEENSENMQAFSADAAVYPMRLKPRYKDYLWGGNRIPIRYKRQNAPDVCAESWELCDRVEASSEIINGPLAGQTLRRLLAAEGMAGSIYGASGRFPFFPVLCKILDARMRLSVQVHPTPESAAELHAEPKSEIWVVLDSTPDARIYLGLKPGVDEAALRAALKQGSVEQLLVPHAVRAGDVFNVPAGTVHAVGEGCLIYEVQQNSNTTYRLFDWNRLAPGGAPRELHIEKALRSIVWNLPPPTLRPMPRISWLNFKFGSESRLLIETPFFRVERLTISGLCACGTLSETPHVLFVEQGRLVVDSTMESLQLSTGDTVLVPAEAREYGLSAEGGTACVLKTTLPSQGSGGSGINNFAQ